MNRRLVVRLGGYVELESDDVAVQSLFISQSLEEFLTTVESLYMVA
jgi:hypothetical protein